MAEYDELDELQEKPTDLEDENSCLVAELQEAEKSRDFGMKKASCDAVSEPPANQKPPHSNKLRFCKYCGAVLSPADSTCPHCGKKVRIVIPWKKTAFFSLLVLSLVGNVVLGIIVETQRQELNLEKQYSFQDLNAGKDLSWGEIYHAGKLLGDASLMGLTPDQFNSLAFANGYVAVVTKNGTKWHHPNCWHLANASEVYIYSIAGVEKAGYEPCEDCTP